MCSRDPATYICNFWTGGSGVTIGVRPLGGGVSGVTIGVRPLGGGVSGVTIGVRPLGGCLV